MSDDKPKLLITFARETEFGDFMKICGDHARREYEVAALVVAVSHFKLWLPSVSPGFDSWLFDHVAVTSTQVLKQR